MAEIKFESGGHWYDKEGNSRHDADLRVARKENLFPSVTTIMKVLAKPELDTWKLNQVLLASLTLPRVPGESEEDYAKRVVNDFQSTSYSAASIGTDMHDWAEKYIAGSSQVPENLAMYRPTLEALARWIDENVPAGADVEKSMVSELGYAGRVDCQWSGVIVDWKSQGVKLTKTKEPRPDPKFYDEWCSQLVAYARGDMSVRLISVIMSTNLEAPGIWVKEWTEEEKKSAWEIFNSCLIIWQRQKGYCPG